MAKSSRMDLKGEKPSPYPDSNQGDQITGDFERHCSTALKQYLRGEALEDKQR